MLYSIYIVFSVFKIKKSLKNAKFLENILNCKLMILFFSIKFDTFDLKM